MVIGGSGETRTLDGFPRLVKSQLLLPLNDRSILKDNKNLKVSCLSASMRLPFRHSSAMHPWRDSNPQTY